MVEGTRKLAAMADLGDLVVAFDAEHVVGVESDDSQRERIIDVPMLFGVSEEEDEPRVVAFGEGAGNVAVKLGASVWFEEFEPSSVHRVPVFLKGMEARNAVVGVLQREEDMVLLLDIGWLREIDRQGGV